MKNYKCVSKLLYRWSLNFRPSGSNDRPLLEHVGARDPCTFVALKKLLKKHSPDLVFLLETKINGSKTGNLKVSLRFNSCVNVDSIGNSGGLLLLWKDSIAVTILSFSTGYIDARISISDDFEWHFSGFYGDPNPSKRKVSWSLLRHLRDTDSLLWIYEGDFNELLSMNDKVGGSDKSFSGMTQFWQAVDDCNLYDLSYSCHRLTSDNKRDDKNHIQERLDRFLASSSWRDHFRNAHVTNLSFSSSDHHPILLNCVSNAHFLNIISRNFRFETYWLKDDEYNNLVKEA